MTQVEAPHIAALLRVRGGEQPVHRLVQIAVFATQDFKADARRYGLPKDEYLESNHVTPQIYVRVARRMQGRYFLTQHDVHRDRFKPDTICMGSYGTDCHGIQMIQTDAGLKLEGDFNGAADAYESLRRGQRDASQGLVEQIGRLDPSDQVGASVVRALLAESQAQPRRS